MLHDTPRLNRSPLALHPLGVQATGARHARSMAAATAAALAPPVAATKAPAAAAASVGDSHANAMGSGRGTMRDAPCPQARRLLT